MHNECGAERRHNADSPLFSAVLLTERTGQWPPSCSDLL